MCVLRRRWSSAAKHLRFLLHTSIRTWYRCQVSEACRCVPLSGPGPSDALPPAPRWGSLQCPLPPDAAGHPSPRLVPRPPRFVVSSMLKKTVFVVDFCYFILFLFFFFLYCVFCLCVFAVFFLFCFSFWFFVVFFASTIQTSLKIMQKRGLWHKRMSLSFFYGSK